jgi:hypothetical protein
LKIKIRTQAVAISLLLTFASAFNAHSATQEAAETRFKGSIAQSKFEMTLRRIGNELNGTYFYSKSGSANALTLRGKIDANGNFTMQELDTAGKQTGEFKGAWKEDPNEPGSLLEGEWKKPNAKEGQPFWASEQVVTFSNGTQITTKHINESLKAKRFDITAEYPELVGGANVSGFNQLVKTRVSKETSDVRKQMLSLTAEDLKLQPKGVNTYLEINYDIDYADNDLIGVRFVESSFTGGAHPNSSFFTITYDLKNGRELKLAELFKPGAKYLQAVSAYAIKDLQGRKMPDSDENMGLAQDIFAEGAMAKAENYRNWIITKKGLMFSFDPYQVGPYAAGPQFVIVPYAVLREIAKPNGVLAKMMK